MTSPKPLHGIDLIDCAQANARAGLSVATQQCGYGNNIKAFQNELQKASSEIGIHAGSLSELILDTHKVEREQEFAPDSSGRI
ncbi:hypothetical protein IQ255_05885 [Pleurocapsales cyanobacterium LEGE 10410]|nr:hypothetical protein [Pleurocapsales cyanobacterium LEGE 10410]